MTRENREEARRVRRKLGWALVGSRSVNWYLVDVGAVGWFVIEANLDAYHKQMACNLTQIGKMPSTIEADVHLTPDFGLMT